MNQRNISRWYALGLTALLVVGCLLLAVGSTWARYRTDYTGAVNFSPEEPAGVLLGTISEETGEFTETDVLEWKEAEEELKLNFAISNDTSSESQNVRVRLIVSLGAWNEEQDPDSVTLSDGTDNRITTHVERIGENTSMYYAFGDGWVFRFLNKDGEEVSWVLEGGKLSCQELEITIDVGTLSDVSLVQLQIDTDFAD